MFPMVSDLDDWRRAREIYDDVRQELGAESGELEEVEVGIMIEVPSAALLAPVLAPEVDFFSIGTNDLTQYTLAVDRTNERVAKRHDPLHPAVLQLIHRVIESAHAHGRWVGLCGELAADLLATPLLLGMGLDEFSCHPPAIPALKARIRELNLADCQSLAAEVLRLGSPDEVRARLAAVP